MTTPALLVLLAATGAAARPQTPSPPRQATRPLATTGLAVRDLTVEYARSPLGIEAREPRLSWRLESPRRGQKQTAYRILVASSAELLAAGRADVWDSGQVASDASTLVPYRGPPLRSRQRCHWKVRVWDAEGRAAPDSEPAWWEMGLLAASDWRAEWIGYPAGWTGRALYFRHEFKVPKAVRSARAYVAGLGYHELRLNGAKVGDHVLDPAWTDASKRVLYVTHDVTAGVRAGDNVLAAIVGHGWYGTPKLLVQLEITYADGTTLVVASGGGNPPGVPPWRVTSGPLLTDSIYDGEVYDARLEKPGWDLPGKLPASATPADRTEGWLTAVPVEPPSGRLVAQALEPIRVVETRAPVRLTEPLPGVFVFDTGQNLAGWAQVRVQGRRGSRLTLKFAENLAPDGTVNQANLRKAAATDVYVRKGEGEEIWEPRFTYHGFRYVQAEGWEGRPRAGDLMARVVRSAVEPNGGFASGNPLLDRIDRMVRWTEASNLHGVPTDCPQRDERMGWMNDLTVRIEQALYNFRLPRFYTKFLNDVRDTQAPDGSITDTAPYKWGRRPADPVSASYLLLAWELYQHYGDTRPMAEHFAGFRAWVDFIASTAKDGIVPYGSWGDWSPPAAFSLPGSPGASAIARETPLPLMSTGYLQYCARLLAQMARALGNAADERRYDELARDTAAAFNRAFLDPSTGGYGHNNQAANAFALFLGVVPDAQLERVVSNLVEDVVRHDHHLTTGNLATKYLLETLTEHGHADVAYRIATQETYPSWGFMLKNGATTLWERWEHLTGGQMNSHNHPMMGSVGSWLYKYLAGLRPDPSAPGWRRFIVRPHVIERLGWVRATVSSLYGRIESAWRLERDRFSLRLTIPVGSSATVFVPGANAAITESARPAARTPGIRFLRNDSGAAVYEVQSGSYELIAKR